MNLMNLPISVNYINVKWRVKNSRNLNKKLYLCNQNQEYHKMRIKEFSIDNLYYEYNFSHTL